MQGEAETEQEREEGRETVIGREESIQRSVREQQRLEEVSTRVFQPWLLNENGLASH